MSTGNAPSLDLAMKISDLSSTSQLQSLLEGQAKPAFLFAVETEPYWESTVEKVPAGTKLSFKLSDNGCWKTKTGISFALTPNAECDLEIVPKGCVIQYCDSIESSAKSDLPVEDYSGAVYVKLSLCFNLSGNVSGAGNVGALGISGNAKGGAGASFVFAHKVKCGTLLKDAINDAFTQFVFPFQPSCATDMAAGDIAEVTFSGNMCYELQLTYGLATYNFAAPSVTAVLQSCTKGMASLSLPQGTVNIGANANLGITHSDDFTAIVQKKDDANAFLFLMRAQKTDVSGGAGVGATISITGTPGVTVDQDKLAAGVDAITHGKGGKPAAAASGALQDALNGKLNDWVCNVTKNGASIKAAWDRTTDTTLVTKYKIALGNPGVLDHTWNYFCEGDIRAAVGAGGLQLEPGSGVSHELSRSFTLDVCFFNFFHASDVDSYFQTSRVSITPTGGLRFFFDVGEENDITINKVLQKTRMHFVAEANATATADVKLEIELCETKDKDAAAHIAALAGYLPNDPHATAAGNDMRQFVAAHPNGTLSLSFSLESSAYGKLTCSPYDGEKPPVDQLVDARNWKLFADASVSLLSLELASGLNYAQWQKWNEACTGESFADRRHPGDPTAGESVWLGQPPDKKLKLGYFCGATSSFMNLCDDLQQLAERIGTAKIPDDWNLLLNDLKDIVKNDMNVDFAKPVVAAILTLCAPQDVSYEKQDCGDSLTCTITLM